MSKVIIMCLEGKDGSAKLPVASSQELLERLVRSELNSDDITIALTAGSNKGDNYFGVIFRAQAECRQTGKKLNVIVKLPPQSEARRNQFFARPSFEREISFYTEIYPMMAEFQREKGIDLTANDGSEAFSQIPHCYRTCLVEFGEAILMGDLKDLGFEMFDRHQEQKFEHFELVMKTLGRFHALSFALKDQHPERIEPYKAMVELFTTREDDATMEQWFRMQITRAMEALDQPSEPEVYEKTKKALDGRFMEMIKELTTGKLAEPYAVICHGDCWNNNMMFRHENDIPVDIRLLDWPVCRYASPVLDLMYFIFTASSKAFRDQHYEALLDVYHQSLSGFLRRLGSDPEKLFPRKALDEQLKTFGRFGLLMVVILLPVMITKSDDGCSVPKEDQHPERIEPYKAMVELFTTREDDATMEQWFRMQITRAMEALDQPSEPEVYEKTKKALDGRFMEMIKELTTGKLAEPYAVICHGDCWNNNMMFRHENDIPVDIRLLDWPVCRYASPVLDLMYFIFTASSKAFRDQHYEALLDVYHQSLSGFLRRLGSDPEKLFPRKALDEQLKTFGRFGLLMVVILLPVMITKSDDVPDLEEMAERLESGADVSEEVHNFRSESTEAIYREKMTGCCRDMVRLGYI